MVWGANRLPGGKAGKEKPTVPVRAPWVFGKRTFSLWSENFHGWDGAHVGLASSALSGSTLENGYADDVATSGAGVID